MAHKVGQGSTQNGRDSNPQYRGIKKFGGASVQSGDIIVRQVGTRYHPGRGVRMGTDYTIFSVTTGRVIFESRDATYVHVIPAQA
ncbi:MAG: 50S ribosomal protein L27 [Planctomycetota bacterium]